MIVSLRSIQIVFMALWLVKLITFVIIKTYLPDWILQLGGDADFYDDFAQGCYSDGHTASVWPIFLNYLSSLGFYSRQIVSWVLFVLATLIIPFLIASLLPRTKNATYGEITYWHVAVIVSLYPTLFAYSFDIYRDVPIIFIFGACLLLARDICMKWDITNLVKIVCFLSLTYMLYSLRDYLGFSLVAATLLFSIYRLRMNLASLFFGYLGILLMSHYLGLFDPLLQYRSRDVFIGGGSTLGIKLISTNSFEFIAGYLSSVLLQLLGLYLTSIKALFVFVLETLSFIAGCYYIVKNRKYMTPFLWWLVFISVAYGTIWIMGNDNLGTAVRLRMYNYLIVLIVAASVFLQKQYTHE